MEAVPAEPQAQKEVLVAADPPEAFLEAVHGVDPPEVFLGAVPEVVPQEAALVAVDLVEAPLPAGAEEDANYSQR